MSDAAKAVLVGVAIFVAVVVGGIVLPSITDSDGTVKTTASADKNTKSSDTSDDSESSDDESTSTSAAPSEDEGKPITCRSADNVINYQYTVILRELEAIEKGDEDATATLNAALARRTEAFNKLESDGCGRKTAKGTRGNPLIGREGNTDPVGGRAVSWQNIVKEHQDDQWYWEGLQQHNGITKADAERAAKLEQDNPNWEPRYIIVSNDPVSDGQAKAGLVAQGFEDVDALPVVRKNGINNTRGLANNRMEAWPDKRSQVRITLALPLDWSDLSKGLETTRGVLDMCTNGWKDLVEEAPPASPVTSTTQVTTNTTTVNTTAPPTTAPPTTAPPTTAPPTTAPPTTTAVPTTVPRCERPEFKDDPSCRPTSE